MSAETVAMTPNGGHLARGRVRQFTNRTAGVTVLGAVLMLDRNRVNGATTSPELSWENVIAVTAKGVGQGPLLVSGVAGAAIGSKFNAVGGIEDGSPIFVERCLVNGNSVNIVIGDELTAVAASDRLVKVVAQADVCAIAQAAATTDGALIPVIFYSKPFKKT